MTCIAGIASDYQVGASPPAATLPWGRRRRRVTALLVGEAPSRASEGLPAFSVGPSARRLAQLGAASARAVNLLDRWPGRDGKGSAFPMDEARERAEALLLEREGQRVVLAGRRVARAFGLRAPERLPYLTWAEHRGVRVAVLPHPSGINRWYNEAGNVELARRFLSQCT